MRPTMSQTEPDPRPACIRIGMRRPLAGQVRQEEQPLASRGACLACAVMTSYGSWPATSPRPTRSGRVDCGTTASCRLREDTAHHMPLATHCMTEGVHASFGIDLDLVAVRKHHPAVPIVAESTPLRTIPFPTALAA